MAGAGLWPGLLLAQASELPLTPGEMSAWVSRLQQSAANRTVAGTLVYSAAEVVSSTRISHIGRDGQIWERQEALDGRLRRSIRHGDAVFTFWPSERVAVVEPLGPASLAMGLAVPEVRATETYRVREIGQQRLAGREAQIMLMEPADGWRFAQRLWADRATGFLLRADVLDRNGQVLESLAFSDVDLDAKAGWAYRDDPMRGHEGYRLVRLVAQPTRLQDEGWRLTGLPPGFRLLDCVRRTMGDPLATAQPADLRTVQAVFSDGLARVSVFIEPVEPGASRRPLLTKLGATFTLMKPLGDWWLTVMGDVPVDTLKRFAGGLQRTDARASSSPGTTASPAEGAQAKPAANRP
jgi:sigma-E factor negative regulatory protein RseB